MTRAEIVGALSDRLNVGAQRIEVDGQPGWLISWGRMPRPSIMVQDAGLTPETLKERVAAWSR